MTPPAIAPARLLDEEAEELDEADVVLVGPMTAELVRGNSIALPPQHDVALTVQLIPLMSYASHSSFMRTCLQSLSVKMDFPVSRMA